MGHRVGVVSRGQYHAPFLSSPPAQGVYHSGQPHPNIALFQPFPAHRTNQTFMIQGPTLFKWQGASLIKQCIICVSGGGLILVL